MSIKRADILQIRKYLNGELDAAAMHRLEREAQDDPFLMDALEGYQANPKQPYPANDLDDLLQQRIDQSRKRRIPWLYISVAASVFLFLTIGYLLWPSVQQPPAKKEVAVLIAPPPADHQTIKPDTLQQNIVREKRAAVLTAAINKPRPALKQAQATHQAAPAAAEIRIDEPVGNSDNKAVAEDAVAKATPPANQNLPANTIARRQTLNNYSYQANPSATKDKNDSVPLKEITVAGYGTLAKKDITAPNAAPLQTLQGKVKGATVTTPPRINGTISDELGAALPGVSVLLNGTRNSAVTDDKGRFSIPANGQTTTLTVNSLGYESKQVKADANDSLQIKLTPTNASLNEVVVVTGYGQAKRVVKAAHPRFGWDEYNKYLKHMAVTDGSGTVSLTFIVSGHGELSNFQIIKGINDVINQQAIELVKKGPLWDGDTSGEPKTIKLKIHFDKK